MSDNSKNIVEDQEIDLSLISKKIGNFFENISTWIFGGFLFLKRNVLSIGILILLGLVLGFFLDKNSKSYTNEIIVSPNFGSTDYLYSKIELIKSKISENDTVFLKEVIGVKKPKNLKKISIKPIIDIYKFINSSEKNFELVKLMAEDGDFKKIVKEDLTSKNYPFHTISFETKNKIDNDSTIQPILNYLNNSEYYNKIQKVLLNNIQIKVSENDSIISQIDGFLNTFSNTLNGSSKSDKLIYYNENTQLNEVIKTKDALNKEQGNLRLDLVNNDKIIKDITTTINIRNIKGTNNKMKFILPALFIFLFILGGIIKSYYRRQMAKLNR
jgi:hypothetical protein